MRARTLIGFTFGVAAAVAASSAPVHAGEIILNIVDPPGVGFNDTTSAAPVGGNAGTTLGEQRRIVFQTAASIWETTLQPNVDIVIQASFAPLPCTATAGVLGSAGTIQIFANFEHAQWPNTWYHAALANHLAGTDLTPGGPDPGLLAPPFNDDIVAFFNGDIGVNPDCLTGLSWYNGLDNNEAANEIDLLTVVLHEFAHGLGFANFTTEADGTAILGLGDIYGAYTFDNEQKLFWNQMDKRQRAASATNAPHVVWRGPNVFTAASGQLAGVHVVRVNAPAAIAGDYTAQPASYGTPVPDAPGITGEVVLFNDNFGADPNDACEPVVDPGVNGKIALINRGTCQFAVKSAVAQNSGAIGVIIANNVPGLPPMGGTDLIPPTIPSVGLSQADANLIKTSLPGVNVTLIADSSLGFSGADPGGFPRLYTPSPVEPGSSLSHWDTTLTPNKLMEPAINADLKSATTLDLTPFLMKDIGWSGGPHCPVGADDRETVAVGRCETGIPNTKGPYAFSLGVPRTIPELPASLNGNASGVDAFGGCYIQDMVNACLNQGSRGAARSCLSHVTKYLEAIVAISASDGQAIMSCAP
ncbi:MAG TPA: PA domain-containing protein [Vicinamibacterales bacterium]|nr:PA domain-containing protein [Vicinamibacterales bacterium]